MQLKRKITTNEGRWLIWSANEPNWTERGVAIGWTRERDREIERRRMVSQCHHERFSATSMLRWKLYEEISSTNSMRNERKSIGIISIDERKFVLERLLLVDRWYISQSNLFFKFRMDFLLDSLIFISLDRARSVLSPPSRCSRTYFILILLEKKNEWISDRWLKRFKQRLYLNCANKLRKNWLKYVAVQSASIRYGSHRWRMCLVL